MGSAAIWSRMLTEPVEVVVFAGSACQQIQVDIRGLGAQHGADGGEERMGMVGLRDSGPVPVEEVPVQVLSGLPRVLLEQRDRVAPPAKPAAGRSVIRGRGRAL